MKICSKLTGQRQCRSVVSIKLQNNFIVITLWYGDSPDTLLHIFRTPFLKNTSRRLILNHTSFTYLTKLEKKLFSYISTLLLVKFIVIQHIYSNVWIVDKNIFYSCRICVSRTLNILSFSVSCIILDGYTKDY